MRPDRDIALGDAWIQRSAANRHEMMVSSHSDRSGGRAACSLAALVGVTCAGVLPRDARAEAADVCASAPVPVRVDRSLDPSWMRAVQAMCASLAKLQDIDRSARLAVERSATAGSARVHVDLADGRSAEREVTLPDHLAHVVEALVTVPPSPRDRRPPAASASRAEAPPNDDASKHPPRPREAPSKGLAHVEVGGQVVGRLYGARGYGAVGITLAGDVHVDRWLVGLTARWDPAMLLLTDQPEDFEMMSFGGGLEVGRRFSPSRFADVDAGLALHLVGEVQSVRVDSGRPDLELEDGVPHATATVFDVRAQPWVQLHLGEGGGLRPTATLAFEVSPLRLGRGLVADAALPELPSWGASLGLGVSWDGS